MEVAVKDYYEIGSRDSIVISNSAISKINPEQGGSPYKFLAFFDKDPSQKKNEAMERGTMIHNWIQNPDVFAIADVNKPTAKLGELVDEVIRIRNSEVGIRDTILMARANIEYNLKLKEATFWEKWDIECKPYFEFIQTAEAEDKVVLTKPQEELLYNVQNSLRMHKLTNELLFGRKEGHLYHEEEEVYWEEIITLMTGEIKIACKAKIDDFNIDFTNKVITLNDIKSTRYDAPLYATQFELWHTYRQLSVYKRAIVKYLEQNNYDSKGSWTWKFNIIVCETKKPYQVKVFSVSKQWIDKGNIEFNSLLTRVANHIEKSNWEQSIEEIKQNGYERLHYNEA